MKTALTFALLTLAVVIGSCSSVVKVVLWNESGRPIALVGTPLASGGSPTKESRTVAPGHSLVRTLDWFEPSFSVGTNPASMQTYRFRFPLPTAFLKRPLFGAEEMNIRIEPNGQIELMGVDKRGELIHEEVSQPEGWPLLPAKSAMR